MLFSVQTPAAGGTAFAQFAAAWCYDGNGYILNDTGTSLDVRIGASGSVITLAASALLPIKLVNSMAELYVRRTDQSTTQVTVEAQVGTGSAGGGTTPVQAGVIAATAAAAATAAHNADAGAHGFGVYTVAQLNAFTSANRPIVCVYCSDCISFSTTGGMVYWSSVLSSWRLVAFDTVVTTDWATFCLDVFANSQLGSVTGNTISVLKSFIDQSGVGTTTNSGANSLALIRFSPNAVRSFATGTTSTGVAKTTYGSTATHVFGLAPGLRWAFGVRSVWLTSSAEGAFLLFGVSPTGPNGVRQTIPSTFYGFALDPGNIAGSLNTGLSANWITVNRDGAVNLSGTGATSVAPVTTEEVAQDIMVVADSLTLKFYIAGSLVKTVTATASAGMAPWFQFTNDGVSSTSRSLNSKTLCFVTQLA